MGLNAASNKEEKGIMYMIGKKTKSDYFNKNIVILF